VPVFGFGVAFTQSEDITGKFGALAKDGNCNAAGISACPTTDGTLWQWLCTALYQCLCATVCRAGLQTQAKYRGIEADVSADDVRFEAGKTLNHIACEDRQPTSDRMDDAGQWQGQVALMTLKGDVDNLGTIFQQGLQEPTFAKMAALSRQMNAFFAIWLPALCATEFPNTYTVFAGGDDFFLIGPWHSTQKLAARMAAEFKTYVAQPRHHLFCRHGHDQAGPAHSCPGHPGRSSTWDAAKGSDKNALVLFNERVRWR
jgi:CRISPR-associated protein Csm1